MIKNTEKSKEVLKAEQAVAQAKARLDEAKRKESQKKGESENRHKYMMPKHMVMTMVNKVTMESFFFICVCTLYYQC